MAPRREVLSFTLVFDAESGLPKRRFQLVQGRKEVIKIGRASKNDICYTLPGISWIHAEIRLVVETGEPCRLTICDLSVNGTGLQAPSDKALRKMTKDEVSSLEDGTRVVMPMKIKQKGTTEDNIRRSFTLHLDHPTEAPHLVDGIVGPEDATQSPTVSPSDDVGDVGLAAALGAAAAAGAGSTEAQPLRHPTDVLPPPLEAQSVPHTADEPPPPPSPPPEESMRENDIAAPGQPAVAVSEEPPLTDMPAQLPLPMRSTDETNTTTPVPPQDLGAWAQQLSQTGALPPLPPLPPLPAFAASGLEQPIGTLPQLPGLTGSPAQLGSDGVLPMLPFLPGSSQLFEMPQLSTSMPDAELLRAAPWLAPPLDPQQPCPVAVEAPTGGMTGVACSTEPSSAPTLSPELMPELRPQQPHECVADGAAEPPWRRRKTANPDETASVAQPLPEFPEATVAGLNSSPEADKKEQDVWVANESEMPWENSCSQSGKATATDDGKEASRLTTLQQEIAAVPSVPEESTAREGCAMPPPDDGFSTWPATADTSASGQPAPMVSGLAGLANALIRKARPASAAMENRPKRARCASHSRSLTPPLHPTPGMTSSSAARRGDRSTTGDVESTQDSGRNAGRSPYEPESITASLAEAAAADAAVALTQQAASATAAKPDVTGSNPQEGTSRRPVLPQRRALPRPALPRPVAPAGAKASKPAFTQQQEQQQLPLPQQDQQQQPQQPLQQQHHWLLPPPPAPPRPPPRPAPRPAGLPPPATSRPAPRPAGLPPPATSRPALRPAGLPPPATSRPALRPAGLPPPATPGDNRRPLNSSSNGGSKGLSRLAKGEVLIQQGRAAEDDGWLEEALDRYKRGLKLVLEALPQLGEDEARTTRQMVNHYLERSQKLKEKCLPQEASWS